MYSQSTPDEATISIARLLSREAGFTLMTMNNEAEELNTHRIEKFGISQVFEAFLSSCWLGVRKPIPRFYNRGLGIAYAEPETSLFIDDRPQNIISAGTLGMTLLLRVKDIMRTDDSCPVLKVTGTSVQQAIFAMTKAKAGAVALVDAKGQLTGIFTDGDFRRSALSGGADFLRKPVNAFMTKGGKTVPVGALAVEALKIFQQLKISDLFAVDAKGRPAGYIDVQDLPKLRIL